MSGSLLAARLRPYTMFPERKLRAYERERRRLLEEARELRREVERELRRRGRP